MLTGMLAARAMLGEKVDPWSVNAEGEYIEENTEVIEGSRFSGSPAHGSLCLGQGEKEQSQENYGPDLEFSV